MPSGFQNVRFHAGEKKAEDLAPLTSKVRAFRGIRPAGPDPAPDDAFANDESAARYYCSKVFEQEKRPLFRGLLAPQDPGVVPDLKLQRVQAQKGVKSKLVHFSQEKSSIPVFGSHVVVELGEKREFVSLTGNVAEIAKISVVAKLPPQGALQSIEKATGKPAAQMGEVVPKLTFFHHDADKTWHLAWLCEKVKAAPKEYLEEMKEPRDKRKGHGLGRSPRELNPILTYLVDAHDGTILMYFSAMPTVSIVKCKGVDEHGINQTFRGEPKGAEVELHDGLTNVKTYDLAGKDFSTSQFPPRPCSNATADWAKSNTAAVSAHIHALKVNAFFKTVLDREGVDDKGMDLVSVVNCTYEEDEAGPLWHNAVWYENRMWYGRMSDGNGGMWSYARYLDVIAHEITHGVTENTANLIYKSQSGALNESFSDIFGILIFNWATGKEASAKDWSWQIGPGLGGDKIPLRDLSNPALTGDPGHMKDYQNTWKDNGGVHINSNIHNKAAYNVLTSAKPDGTYEFQPMDVALLYYLCLQRLSPMSEFSDALQALLDAASTYYGGDMADQTAKLNAIKAAYAAVGIE